MVGSMLVIVVAASAAAIMASPTWHHAPGPSPGSDLRWPLLGAVVAAVVPMAVHIVARTRRTRWVDLLDIVASSAGVVASVAILFASRTARMSAADRQSLPDVVNIGRVVALVCVLGVVFGAVNLLARRARLERRSRHRLRRRFGFGVLVSVTTLGVIATAVAWPLGESPTVSQASQRGAGWVSEGYRGDQIRIDWHHAVRGDAWGRLTPAPIAGGFALAGDMSVTGFVGGAENWTVQFARPVLGVWGSTVSETNTSSPVIVQVRDLPTATVLTYRVDGDSGRIDWTTDALAPIEFGRFDQSGGSVLTWGDDGSSAVVELALSDGSVTTRVRIGPQAPGCARPARFDFVDGAIAVPVVCAGAADRIDSYDYASGTEFRSYTGADFGVAGADVRVTASVGSVAAIDVRGDTDRKNVFLTASDVVAPDLPDGWTVTGLARTGDDWAITGVDPNGRAAVVYANPARHTQSIVPTGADGDRDGDDWAPIGGSLLTTSSYTIPAVVDDSTSFPQVAPLTFVGAPVPGSGTLQPLPAVTVKASPCRLTRTGRGRVFGVGAGVLLRCDGPTPASRELFLLR